MKVILNVNWRGKEILTVGELAERIHTRVDEAMKNKDTYDECLENYLDCNYTIMELFDALSGSDAEREEVVGDIRSGVAEAIYNWVNMDISSDYEKVTIEV